MICVEKRLDELFVVLPAVNNYQPTFEFGSQEELARHLKYEGEIESKVYPLIWLITPVKSTGEDIIESNISLIIAARSNVIDKNYQRLPIFTIYLLPIIDNIKKALRESGFSGIKNPEKSSYTNYFNYQAPTEIWDAVRFDCTITMNTCEQKTIHF